MDSSHSTHPDLTIRWRWTVGEERWKSTPVNDSIRSLCLHTTKNDENGNEEKEKKKIKYSPNERSKSVCAFGNAIWMRDETIYFFSSFFWKDSWGIQCKNTHRVSAKDIISLSANRIVVNFFFIVADTMSLFFVNSPSHSFSPPFLFLNEMVGNLHC